MVKYIQGLVTTTQEDPVEDQPVQVTRATYIILTPKRALKNLASMESSLGR